MNINWKLKPTFIYGIPTGYTNRNNEVKMFNVFKITNTKVWVTETQALYKNTGKESKYDAYGYIFFDSISKVERYKEKLILIGKIIDATRYQSHLKDISYNDIKDIASILNISL